MWIPIVSAQINHKMQGGGDLRSIERTHKVRKGDKLLSIIVHLNIKFDWEVLSRSHSRTLASAVHNQPAYVNDWMMNRIWWLVNVFNRSKHLLNHHHLNPLLHLANFLKAFSRINVFFWPEGGFFKSLSLDLSTRYCAHHASIANRKVERSRNWKRHCGESLPDQFSCKMEK